MTRQGRWNLFAQAMVDDPTETRCDPYSGNKLVSYTRDNLGQS